MVLALLTLAACSNDFALSSAERKPGLGDDTGSAPVDTAGDTEPADTADTGAAETDTVETDTGPAPDTAPAEDTEPAPDTAVEDPPPADDCTETDDLIYALDRDDARLYTFDPPTRAFTSLGRLACATSATAASMAVSRDGVAYVRYSDDSVWAVDLATLDCTPTSYSDRRTGFGSFGMGYSTDAADTWRETLYVANGTKVAAVDTATWTLTELGRMPSQSELTGNADGELWAMLPLETPAQLTRIDTASGRIAESIDVRGLPDAGDLDTFAFATWGGDFYLFIREYGMGSTTDVYLVTRTGVTSKILVDVGFDVVGAGVSTCAPS